PARKWEREEIVEISGFIAARAFQFERGICRTGHAHFGGHAFAVIENPDEQLHAAIGGRGDGGRITIRHVHGRHPAEIRIPLEWKKDVSLFEAARIDGVLRKIAPSLLRFAY